jgi:hypothetical protein
VNTILAIFIIARRAPQTRGRTFLHQICPEKRPKKIVASPAGPKAPCWGALPPRPPAPTRRAVVHLF